MEYHSLHACCTGAIWAVECSVYIVEASVWAIATYMWIITGTVIEGTVQAVTNSIWTVEAAVWAIAAFKQATQPLCVLLNKRKNPDSTTVQAFQVVCLTGF